MELGAELRRLRHAAGLTQKQLAGAAGVAQAFVSQLEAGERTNPSLDTLARLSKALGVPPETLASAALGGPAPPPARRPKAGPEPLLVPIRGKVKCGPPAENGDGDETGEFLDLRQLFGRDDLVIYVVDGDSMIGDAIRPGDHVFVKRLADGAEPPRGGRVLAWLDRELTLKRYFSKGRGKQKRVRLESRNPDVPPIEVDPNKQYLQVLGVVYAVLRLGAVGSW